MELSTKVNGKKRKMAAVDRSLDSNRENEWEGVSGKEEVNRIQGSPIPPFSRSLLLYLQFNLVGF